VTFAIESSVALARVFGVTNISAAAKAGDQFLAVAGLLASGTIAGALLFALLETSDEPALLFGAILGVMLAGLALLAERRLQRLPAGSMLPAVWIAGTCIAWGLAFGWFRDRGEPSLSRRALLLAAIATVLGVATGRGRRASIGRRWSDDHALPNSASTVVPVPGTRPEFTPIEAFYRIDTDTRAPAIDGGRWQVDVAGLVDSPRPFTLADLRALPRVEIFATLCCISNPPGGDLISTTRWSGVSLQHLLVRVRPGARATHLKVTSADGFFEVVSLDAIRADERVMLAYEFDGAPLTAEHGFPARLFVPDLYGMKQPKWITRIEAISQWEPGYWVMRGWDREGKVVPSAAVDTVVRTGEMAHVGGIAFAGARGVAKVEVQVDGAGEWHPAQMREPLSGLTWVIWRATVPIGKRYTARCSAGA